MEVLMNNNRIPVVLANFVVKLCLKRDLISSFRNQYLTNTSSLWIVAMHLTNLQRLYMYTLNAYNAIGQDSTETCRYWILWRGSSDENNSNIRQTVTSSDPLLRPHTYEEPIEKFSVGNWEKQVCWFTLLAENL